MPERIEKMNAWGSLLNSWFKIAAAVIMIIGYGFLTYYQIRGNSQSINELKILIKDNNTLIEKEFEIWADRSDKRYERSMGEAEELKAADSKLENIMMDAFKEQQKLNIELTKELYFIKGQLSK
jgi:hypothetical protein